MSEDLSQQYQAIRGTILQNIHAIKDLVQQAKTLYTIADSLVAVEDADKKQQILAEIDKMSDIIDQLITQTESLFDAYTKLYHLVS